MPSLQYQLNEVDIRQMLKFEADAVTQKTRTFTFSLFPLHMAFYWTFSKVEPVFAV